MQAHDFIRKFLDKGFSLRMIDNDGGTEIRATKDGNTVACRILETSQPFRCWDPEALLERRADELLDLWHKTRRRKLSSALDETTERVL